MKSHYYIVLLVLAYIYIPQQGFAQQDTNSLLVGTWTINYEASFAKMEQSTKAFYDTIAPAQRLTIDKVYRDRQATFGSDGSYVQTLADGRTSIGTWAIDKNGKDLIITDPTGKTYTQKIKVLTNTELMLKPEVKGEGKMLVSEWHFTKN